MKIFLVKKIKSRLMQKIFKTCNAILTRNAVAVTCVAVNVLN